MDNDSFDSLSSELERELTPKKPMPIIPRDWTLDKKFLEDIISSEIQKVVYLKMDIIISEDRPIRKPEMDNIIQETVLNVLPFISSSYRAILEHYIEPSKLEEYIISQIFFELVVLMRNKNKVTLNKVTSFKTTADVMDKINNR